MTRFFLYCLALWVVTGCGSKPSTEPATAPPSKNQGVSVDSAPGQAPAEAPPPAPAATAPEPAQTAATAPTDLQGSTELDDMSKLLQQFVVERKRFPTDVNEMAKLMGFRLPALPAGASLVIDKENKQIRYVPPKK